MWTLMDRRVERSGALDVALEHLLRKQRERGEFDLVVLATGDGLIVASDGPRELCEELAAYAPFLARGRALAVDARLLRGVRVHSFLVGQKELVLAMRGGTNESLSAALALASIQGATRILRG